MANGKKARFESSEDVSVAHAVSADAPKRIKKVFDPNLFAFIVAATFVEADWNFLESKSLAGKLGGDFWLDAKAFLLDVDCFHGFASECLVASFHVCQVQATEQIGGLGQNPIAQPMDEAFVVHDFADESRAINNVCFAANQWLYDRRNVARIVLEVSILNDDEIAGRVFKAGSKRRAFASVFVFLDDLNLWQIFNEIENRPSSISAAVVNDHQFRV